MEELAAELPARIFDVGEDWLVEALNGWVVIQLAIILGCFAAATLLARSIEPFLEIHARRIKGNPDLLRFIVAILRRTRWALVVVLLWFARLAVLQWTWPSNTALISMALSLSAAWLIISILTRLIRNRTLSRIVAAAIWVYFALTVIGFDDETTAALDRAAINLGALRLSLLLVLKVLVLSISLIWLAVFIGNVVANRVDRSEDLSPSFKVLIGKLVKIALILLAGAFALAATGIDLTALTVFSGAVGVGIGFGLQKVVSNFISGIIILLDKSIKPGDTVSVGDTFGWIRELRARFVSVITRDGKEYLIPNEDLITQQVINWSFSSEYVRIDVDFGVSYDSDPHEVSKLAIDAAKTIDRVSTFKEPVCWLTAFGASSLDFRLRFWMSDPRQGLTNVRGEVLMALWDAFKAAGVDIPFPHREIIMRTPVRVESQD